MRQSEIQRFRELGGSRRARLHRHVIFNDGTAASKAFVLVGRGRVGRGPKAPEAQGARNCRGVQRRKAPDKLPRCQIWNSLLV